MPAWKEFLMEDPGTFADEMHRIAGYREVDKIKSIVKDLFGPKRTITINGVTKGPSEPDFVMSRSLIDYVIRRARDREPICGNTSLGKKWAGEEMFFSLTGRQNAYTWIDIVNGRLESSGSGQSTNFISSMKQNGFKLERVELGGLNKSNINDTIQRVVETFVEHDWRYGQSSFLELKEFPLPNLENVEFARGEFIVADLDIEDQIASLIENTKNLHEEIMSSTRTWKIFTEIKYWVDELIVTSNYHPEPIRKVIQRADVSSSLSYRLKGGRLHPGLLGFQSASIVGSLDDLVRHLDEKGDEIFSEKIKTKLKEDTKVEPIGKYGNRTVQAILLPHVAGVFGHEVCHGAEVDYTLDKFDEEMVDSWRIDGKPIFSDNVTMKDDPTDKTLFGYCPFDDLGVVSKKKDLIRKGIRVGKIYGGFDGSGYVEANYGDLEDLVDGHCFGGLARMTNIIVDSSKGGPKDIDDMIEVTRQSMTNNEINIIVFGQTTGGGNYYSFDMECVNIGKCYLIPSNGRWEDRIPLAYVNRPEKESLIKFDDIGYNNIPIIVGSRRHTGRIGRGGLCGKEELTHIVRDSSPMLSIECKLITYGEEKADKLSYKPPIIPIL
jgi:hypothetical protein